LPRWASRLIKANMRILTALDRSEYAEIVLEHGLDQAVRDPHAQLHFVTVVDDDGDIAATRRWLAELVRDGVDAFDLADRTVTQHVELGRPTQVIATLAARLPAELLIIGRFHAPSASDAIMELVDCPTLVVGIEGHVLEPQCSQCEAVRRDSNGERLFCARHSGDRIDLVTRLPPSTNIGSRLW
jgi:nucleotide-binding universal stress UspA family protein